MAFDCRSFLDRLAAVLGTVSEGNAVKRSSHPERHAGMPQRAAALTLTLVGVLVSSPAAAQGPPAPPGPYVVDVRAVSSGVPSGIVSFPTLAADVPIPTRGFGFDVGAHVYTGRIGPARIGFGANLLNVRTEKVTPTTAPSTASSNSTASSSMQAAPPGVHVDMRTLAPQVSFNFGTSDGWSYLSSGAGFTKATARTIGDVELSRSSGWLLTINAGGGARWFLSRRIAFGFDARLHRVGSSDTMPAAMLFSIAAGISLR